jgi:hypothetical protein
VTGAADAETGATGLGLTSGGRWGLNVKLTDWKFFSTNLAAELFINWKNAASFTAITLNAFNLASFLFLPLAVPTMPFA